MFVSLHTGSDSQMARAQFASAAQVHAANLALCEGGPAREMSKAERRLHALNKYKAKRRVSLGVLQACGSQRMHVHIGSRLQIVKAAKQLRRSMCTCAQRQCQLWAAA